MENQEFVQSVLQEIVQPGVERLMKSRYFTELRDGKLSKNRLAGFAMQHYLACVGLFETGDDAQDGRLAAA